MTTTSPHDAGPAAPWRAAGLRRAAGSRPAAVAAAALVVAGALASLFLGAADLAPADLLAARSLDDPAVELLLVSRGPRLLALLLAGSAMAVAGLLMMHLTRNRFVSPSTAGTVEWAQLGLLLATLVLGSTGVLERMLVAVVAALAGTALFLRLLRRLVLADTLLVPLVGLMLGAVVSGVTTGIAYRADLLPVLATWTAGDASGIIAGRFELLWLVVVALAVAWWQADRFTVAGLGEGTAVSLGVDHGAVVRVGLVVVAVVTAVVVVVVGAVPFVALVVPNLVTIVVGDDIRRALPVTAAAGAAFVLLCDVVGRVVVHPYEIPVGTVAGVIGGVVFLVVLLRLRGRGVSA
ncbi:iron chelate uptake ABC transporter family permease subunit [Pseudokineococcus lusitanus]|uniref:Iron complex transport system permease protein n=1 Tax=Pseudokineococcus lusitanus TaxID=763993 RepID=A0A3N1HR47_9ACTN|nr:iron chelate uptake ABC transporter family permease subunit [Pseudokineococcus lusitanus]ROP44896.1 iron complex transport system permease protein [Pseudokineococcus lusitanus]